MPERHFSSVVPAQLSFLTIYNPLLGTTDETIKEQIVFYTTRSDVLLPQDNDAGDHKEPSDDWNERLRQVGLAQGMVTFASNFSEGKAVEYVETEKSQIVLHELEKDWWILASIDLTRLPADHNNESSSKRDASEVSFHYSSREMTPPQLLIQQLRRAHSTFLLHHASSLDTLYKSVGRSKFCLYLENFWLRFAWSWEVLLGGNPAVEIYNGVKLSAGGELGIGVGEEEWGSGEREVLEDFVSRTDGLVDLVVSRFGDPYDPTESPQTTSRSEGHVENRWIGSDAYPRPSDGVIFSGVGAITRRSLASISQWMEWIHRYGADAYGVGEDPTSPRRRKRRKRQRGTMSGKSTRNQVATPDASLGGTPDRPFSPGIPRPLVRGTQSPNLPSKDTPEQAKSQASNDSSQGFNDKSTWVATGTETFVKYLTLGYGSSWGLSGTSSPHSQAEISKRENGSSGAGNSNSRKSVQEALGSNDRPRHHNHGRFIIGLQDCTASPEIVLEETEPSNTAADMNEKITERVLYVQVAGSQLDTTDWTQFQVVVYIHQPFIYTFLFGIATPSLSDPSLYRRIHHQLGPLQKPLSTSTSPSTAEFRICNGPEFNSKPQQQFHSIYDLVYDPYNLSIRSSIPNIPDLESHLQNQRMPEAPSLSRIETINIHHRLLTTYTETRSRPLELERTCKTSRGWWIVWVRVSASPLAQQGTSDTDKDKQQEAFIIRQASDHVAFSSHTRNASSIGGGSGARFFRDLGGASSPGLSLQTPRMDMAPGKLVEGLGFDARRYIENLLSLNR